MLGHLSRLRQYQDLLTQFTLRDIQVRYKQTFLGILWAVAQPLAYMVILTALKSVIFGEQDSEGVPHPVFLYCAMVPWTFFQTGLNFSTTSISGNMNLVKKIYFPREIFPFSAILACTVDFLIASSIFLGMMLVYHIPFTAHLLWIPVLFAIEVAFVLAIAMFVSASNVFYRDVKYIVPLLVQVLFFASPLFYSVSQVPAHLRGWYMLNPMAVVIDGFRGAILHGRGPDPVLLGTTGLVTLLAFMGAYLYFKRCESRFADLI
jgi:lipopolysaccharide transport system permease protein